MVTLYPCKKQPTPGAFAGLTAVEMMRQIWVQQYYIEEGVVHWRTKGNLPPSATMISSPHDTDARYSSKGERTWVGYMFIGILDELAIFKDRALAANEIQHFMAGGGTDVSPAGKLATIWGNVKKATLR